MDAAIAANAGHYVEDWQSWADKGALIVIDEVQRIWRPRSSGAVVPAEISALETHRHKGVDFWIISQSSKLIDNNIRRLVNRHIHLVASWKGRMQYEWPECKESVSGSKIDAVSRPYVLKKSVFSKYKSSSLHTTIEKRAPISVFVIFGAAAILIFFGYDIYKRHSAPETLAVEQSAPVPTSLGGMAQAAIPVIQTSVKPGVFDFHPRTEGRAETAPAYDGILKVQSVPFPVQCLAWTTEKGEFCKCLTDQGTPYNMPLNVCQVYAKGGVYNPYALPADRKASANPAPDSQAAKPVQSVGSGSAPQAQKTTKL